MARRGPRVSFDQAGALGEPGVTASPCLSIPGRQGAMFSVRSCPTHVRLIIRSNHLILCHPLLLPRSASQGGGGGECPGETVPLLEWGPCSHPPGPACRLTQTTRLWKASWWVVEPSPTCCTLGQGGAQGMGVTLSSGLPGFPQFHRQLQTLEEE